MGEYSNDSKVVALLDNIEDKIIFLKKIKEETFNELQTILSCNKCSGDLVTKINKHLDNTILIIDDINNKLKDCTEQIENNAKNCDLVWESYAVGKSIDKNKVTKRTKNDSNGSINVTIDVTSIDLEHSCNGNFGGGISWIHEEIKKNISGNDMVNGKIFTAANCSSSTTSSSDTTESFSSAAGGGGSSRGGGAGRGR